MSSQFTSFSECPDYKCWLQYTPLADAQYKNQCAKHLQGWHLHAVSPVAHNALDELRRGTFSLLGIELNEGRAGDSGVLVLRVVPGTPVPKEGFSITTRPCEDGSGEYLEIASATDRGLLYGVFYLLRLIQCGESLDALNVSESPAFQLRMLNHWDNPFHSEAKTGESVERGYAGATIFDWQNLSTPNPRYRDYARMMASVGINHCVINNVNATARVLETSMLEGIAHLAKIFADWGVQLWLSVNFASPKLIGGLDTADPLDPKVIEWWRQKIDEIYRLMPDFGGFLVKANSEGEPGPIDYGREHHEGANLFAHLLRPYKGVVIWRAFVYGDQGSRAGGAYEHFKPLDGLFAENAVLQVKHGPIDFQQNEPMSPLFGQMPNTNTSLELMITQEYTGQSTHLYYYLPQWKEVLDYPLNPGGTPNPTIGEVVSGQFSPYRYCGVAAVPNVGSDVNWTGHLLAQANFYAYGRLIWNPSLSAETITKEWIQQTFGAHPQLLETLSDILLESRQHYVNYTGAYGLYMLHDFDHFNPAPQNRTQMHCAAPDGIGKDRTCKTGNGEVGNYMPALARLLEDPHTCPEEYLLFFHHLPLDFKLADGRPILEAVLEQLDCGVQGVRSMQERWHTLKNLIDADRFGAVAEKFAAQLAHAEVWKNTLKEYFGSIV